MQFFKAHKSRRDFLKTVLASSAVATYVPATVLGRDGATSANERIGIGIIGCGSRGVENLQLFQRFKQVRILGVCDPVQQRREQARQIAERESQNLNCVSFSDFRALLDFEPIDAVVIATPDHWHYQITLAACLRGRDIFCESPETLTVRQGREMINNVRLYSRVFSGGAYRILDVYGTMLRLAISGGIGDLKEVFLHGGTHPGDCYLPAQPTPQGVDWNLWIGPAPMRPFHQALLDGDFRLYRDYSGGTFAEYGAHLFGAALFAVQQQKYLKQQSRSPQQTLRPRRPFEFVEIVPPDGKEQKYLTYRFDDDLVFHHLMSQKNNGKDNGNTNKKTPPLRFCGTDGELPAGRHQRPERFVDIPWYSGIADGIIDTDRRDDNRVPLSGLIADFLECVRTRKKPFRDIESVHLAATLCHLGNIAHALQRPLFWSAASETFIEDDLANRSLRRPERMIAQ